MAISARNRKVGLKKSQKKIPDATATWYAIGRAGPNPVVAGLGIVGAFVAVAVVVLVLTGYLILLGVLPFLVIHHFMCPPRALVVCDRGVALFGRSLLNGNPTSIIGRFHLSDLRPHEGEVARIRVDVGSEHVWLSAAEETQFRAAVSELNAPAYTSL